jgi:glutamate decarboxylase
LISKKVDPKIAGENHSITYSSRYFISDIPKFKLPDDEMPADAAYQLVKDELNLDGNPALNLATFVTTWMEPEANKLISENLNRNFIDHDEYPQTDIIQTRLVNMIADLFNSPDECNSLGTSTIGSSEAIMLALLAHKWSWRLRMKAAGKDTSKPNIIMGADVHTVWDKFARYFDVEPRIIYMEDGKYTITAEAVKKLIDENTICVGCVLGTTYTGQTDPIKEINEMLLQVKKEKSWNIPIHVDAASGGFVAPFIFPDMQWDFRLEQVKSINTSGHKYGLVYPGIGWVIFRDEKDLPSELIFTVNYLGDEMPTYTLNFSKGSSMLLAQYYSFLRLGKAGYKRIMKNIMDNASYLESAIKKSGYFKIVCDDRILPVITIGIAGDQKFSVFDLSDKMREKGWIIPAYTLPPNAENIEVLRIVLKENQSRDMVDLLIKDLNTACEFLIKTSLPDLVRSKNQGKKIID